MFWEADIFHVQTEYKTSPSVTEMQSDGLAVTPLGSPLMV